MSANRKTWVERYRQMVLSSRWGALGLSAVTSVCAVVALSLSLSRFGGVLQIGYRIDASLTQELMDIRFQWWVTVALTVRFIGKLQKGFTWHLLSIAALVSAFAIYWAWLGWSTRVAEDLSP